MTEDMLGGRGCFGSNALFTANASGVCEGFGSLIIQFTGVDELRTYIDSRGAAVTSGVSAVQCTEISGGDLCHDRPGAALDGDGDRVKGGAESAMSEGRVLPGNNRRDAAGAELVEPRRRAMSSGVRPKLASRSSSMSPSQRRMRCFAGSSRASTSLRTRLDGAFPHPAGGFTMLRCEPSTVTIPSAFGTGIGLTGRVSRRLVTASSPLARTGFQS
jgi:hypothetical protein